MMKKQKESEDTFNAFIRFLKDLEWVKRVSKRGQVHYELSEPLRLHGKKIYISIYEDKPSSSKKEVVKLDW